LATTRNFSLALEGLTGNLNVQLYRDFNNNGFWETNEFVAGSSQPGSLSEFINLQGLAAGNYLVVITRATNTVNDYSDYVLNLEATPL
jgi:hypothetical protein